MQHFEKQNETNIRPIIFQNADYVLQLLYELNIIGYLVKDDAGHGFQHWFFKEKSYAEIRPKVRTHLEYKMHKGIAEALRVLE